MSRVLRSAAAALALLVVFFGGIPSFAADAVSERRKANLQELRRLLPKSEPWEQWLRARGELPPDFAAMTNVPFLPDPIRFQNGREVKAADWPRRRQELLSLFQYYVTGDWPPAPGNSRVGELKTREESGAIVQEAVLEFGPGHKAQLHVELIRPAGDGPFPVFITQDTHRRWALVAVSRGYIGCVYAGADSRDDTAAWPELWPQRDWSKLTRRAWAASRCLDWLHTLPFVDTNRIALAGHSRNGKTALIAAAFDQRVKAVISSSSGAGGACSYRLFSEAEFGESIELLTRRFPDWFHPRLRFFSGREAKLPIDQHELVACIAPRPCLISSALNDNVESLWAIEQTYQSARRAYDLLRRGQDLNLRYRGGGHETRAEDIENYVDWLDAVFGRREVAFPDCAVFPTYTAWKQRCGVSNDLSLFPTNGLTNLLTGSDDKLIQTAQEWGRKRDDIRERVLWVLGEAPPFAESQPGAYGAEAAHRATLLGRDKLPPGLGKRSLNFGNYIAGDLYFATNATNAGAKLPALVWLHPVSVSHGYGAGYKDGDHPHLNLAREGFSVFAFDQAGNGSRLEEAREFYARYPKWSLLGKHVEDTLAAVEALTQIDLVDPRRIYLLGYGTGGLTALHAAALDERVAGVASVGGFTPWRLDTPDKRTGGLARWSVWLPLLPKLGDFVGREAQAPYDVHELLAMIAPRPALVFAPRLDHRATLADVKTAVEEAGRVYELLGARHALRFEELDDWHRFTPATQQLVGGRLRSLP
jgi:dienelactone hydrolase